MVGFDGSVPSRRALVYAAGLAQRNRAALVVAYIAPAPPAVGLTPLGAELPCSVSQEETDEIAALATEILDGAVAGWRFTVGWGDAAHELERLADERRADVLVTGRPRSPARHVLGSVPGRLLRHARRPITVVP
nr:universal stress protein [Pseudonocardia acidicola]